MAGLLTGVTSNTKQNIQLGAGVLLSAFTPGSSITETDIIGATRGGGSFTATPNYRALEADGLPENVKDFKVIDDWAVTLNMTLIEASEAGLKLALGGGATSTTDTASTKITASSDVLSADYKDIWWVGDTAGGAKLAIKLANAMSTGGLNYTIANKGEGTYAVTLTAHYDVSDTKTAPFEIHIEKAGA